MLLVVYNSVVRYSSITKNNVPHKFKKAIILTERCLMLNFQKTFRRRTRDMMKYVLERQPGVRMKTPREK